MIKAAFSHVDTWVFDLDNTLYPPSARLFDQIEVHMTQFVMDELGVGRDEADRLRHDYWRDYGTTLAGLMEVHGIEPDAFLVKVHEISFDQLEQDGELATRIAALPGRRIVYTNGTRPYAEKVLAARGLSDVFDGIYGVEHARFLPKPQQAAFETVFALDGLDTAKAAMFEDDARNLLVPHAMGMRTVHVAPERIHAEHLHHHTDDLTAFIAELI